MLTLRKEDNECNRWSELLAPIFRPGRSFGLLGQAYLSYLTSVSNSKRTLNGTKIFHPVWRFFTIFLNFILRMTLKSVTVDCNIYYRNVTFDMIQRLFVID